MWKPFLVFVFVFATGTAKDCVPYTINGNVLACICNSTYCDGIPENQPSVPEKGSFYWYVSNKGGDRLRMSIGKIHTNETSSLSGEHLILDSTKKYQTILGFGGAFSDSTCMNIRNLSSAAQDQVIRAYFHPKFGSRYNLARIPIGGTDFSTRFYTYDDHANDTFLKYFQLAYEDYEYRIPLVKKAYELNPTTKLFSAAWTAPTWMKTNNNYNGFGFLKKEYYQTYANYLLKFLDAYKENGLDMWAISTGNEPTNAYRLDFPLTTMGWSSTGLADWVSNYMGPSLASSIHNETMILLLDDNRYMLPWFVTTVLNNKNASKYAAGTAVHWYADSVMPAPVLDWTHDAFPDKIILMTEASVEFKTSDLLPTCQERPPKFERIALLSLYNDARPTTYEKYKDMEQLLPYTASMHHEYFKTLSHKEHK